MNERIKELIEQCRMMHKEGTQYIEEFDKEKFAELIIRECVEHISNRAMRAGGKCTIVGEEGLWLARDLETHFGVE